MVGGVQMVEEAVEAATKAVQSDPGTLIRAPGVNNSTEFQLPDLSSTPR